MKFSYFNEGSNPFGLVSFGRGLTGLLSVVAPRVSAFIGKQLLMRPYGKRHYGENTLVADRELNLWTSMGYAHVNLYGQGNQVIILSHGWADSSQSFEGMISSFTEQGYLVAAVDHIGHGKSMGNKSHLLSFIETLEVLIEHFQQERADIKGIVGHSMGAIATLNLPHDLLKDKKVILISSPIKFFELMFEKVEQVGISRKLLITVLKSISKQYGKQWQQLSSENHREKLDLELMFIHDRDDRFAPFADIEQFLQKEENTLFVTQGLGHKRILGDTSVIDNVRQVFAT